MSGAAVLASVPLWAVATASAEIPACLSAEGMASTREAIEGAAVAEHEILARLVHAESISTSFPDDPLVYRAIAWGTMNRVRLAERSERARAEYGSGISGVVFQPGQFGPAVSLRSRFSRDFLCPTDASHWDLAAAAAAEALAGVDNPFVATEWERENGLSLVVNFYYPASVQARGPFAPWEDDPAFRFVGDLGMGEARLPADRVRFYRLAEPPPDVGPPAGAGRAAPPSPRPDGR